METFTLLTAFTTLFFVMDPLGNIPIFLSTLKEIPSERHRQIIIRELLIALGVLLVFLFAGRQLLTFLGLSQPAIGIAGAIVLFLIAVKMIFPPLQGGIMGGNHTGEPFIVPLAIPCVAGPSTMAILMLLASTGENIFQWLLALLGAWTVSSIILLLSTKLLKLLGDRGLTAIERLMGMILVMISVQMMLNGLKSYLG